MKKRMVNIAFFLLMVFMVFGCFRSTLKVEKEKVAKEESVKDEPMADEKIADVKEQETEVATASHEEVNTGSTVSAETTKSAETSEKENKSKTDNGKGSDTKEVTGEETTSSKSADETTTKSEGTTEEAHSHVWVEQYKEVDNGYWTKELVKEAWTEEVTRTKTVGAEICNGCGHAMFTEDEITEHTKSQMLAGNFACGGYHSGYVEVEVTETVEHPAEYKDVWVPKIEKVLTGYVCECGETKQ